MVTNQLTTVIEVLRHANSVLWITGAGISADSGLPTYRGIGGLYEKDNFIEGVPIEVALSGRMFENRPHVCWRAIRQIENAVRGAAPNRAHHIIAASEERFERVVTLTQNVDGLHRQAGSKNVIDIHGDIYDLYCTNCSWRERVKTFAHLDPLPVCVHCQAPIRPDVVLFGELLPVRKVATLAQACHKGFDAVFSVGTTSVFPYIAQPIISARQAGKLAVEINPDSTEVSGVVNVKIAAGAVDTLERLQEALI